MKVGKYLYLNGREKWGLCKLRANGNVSENSDVFEECENGYQAYLHRYYLNRKFSIKKLRNLKVLKRIIFVGNQCKVICYLIFYCFVQITVLNVL